MIVKFFSHGKRTSKKNSTHTAKSVKKYLLNEERVANGTALLVRGDLDETSRTIDRSPHTSTYTSGCLSFAENEHEHLTAQQKQQLMADFEGVLLPDFERERYHCYWVEHTDKGRLELNFVFAKTDLATGKHLDIYQHKRDLNRLNLWKKIQVHQYGLIDPDDHKRPLAFSYSKGAEPKLLTNLLSDENDIDSVKGVLHGCVHNWINEGLYTTQDELVNLINSLESFNVVKKTKTSISVAYSQVEQLKDPNKNIFRLKGAYYGTNPSPEPTKAKRAVKSPIAGNHPEHQDRASHATLGASQSDGTADHCNHTELAERLAGLCNERARVLQKKYQLPKRLADDLRPTKKPLDRTNEESPASHSSNTNQPNPTDEPDLQPNGEPYNGVQSVYGETASSTTINIVGGYRENGSDPLGVNGQDGSQVAGRGEPIATGSPTSIGAVHSSDDTANRTKRDEQTYTSQRAINLRDEIILRDKNIQHHYERASGHLNMDNNTIGRSDTDLSNALHHSSSADGLCDLQVGTNLGAGDTLGIGMDRADGSSSSHSFPSNLQDLGEMPSLDRELREQLTPTLNKHKATQHDNHPSPFNLWRAVAKTARRLIEQLADSKKRLSDESERLRKLIDERVRAVNQHLANRHSRLSDDQRRLSEECRHRKETITAINASIGALPKQEPSIPDSLRRVADPNAGLGDSQRPVRENHSELSSELDRINQFTRQINAVRERQYHPKTASSGLVGAGQDPNSNQSNIGAGKRAVIDSQSKLNDSRSALGASHSKLQSLRDRASSVAELRDQIQTGNAGLTNSPNEPQHPSRTVQDGSSELQASTSRLRDSENQLQESLSQFQSIVRAGVRDSERGVVGGVKARFEQDIQRECEQLKSQYDDYIRQFGKDLESDLEQMKTEYERRQSAPRPRGMRP